MFRTELPIAPATDQLSRTARVLTLGSCFADSIGARLLANKVEALVNPFGTVFQPLALGKLLRAAAGEDVDWQQHLVEARGRWQSYDLHSSIGADSPVELLQTIQALVRRTGEFLQQADVVLLTLGTAWAYRLRETGELVNNCHKQPADLFVRELLTPDEIINNLAETHAYLRRINPNLRFVLTVSPVRHLKDTLPLNSVSKSVLRVATHIVSDLLPGVAYFPAYELLMDDLRDYRFYAADMLHPSEVAEDYIWDKFARTYFDVEFGRFRKEWASVRQSLEHRPLHAGAPEHRQFLEATREKLEQLSLRKVDVRSELSEVRTRIAALPELRQPEPTSAPEDDEERIDIGEAEANNLAARVPADAVPFTEERPPRLTPEEFRAQRPPRSGRAERGRRDGRGKHQPVLPSENEVFQAGGLAAPEPVAVPVAAAVLPEVTSPSGITPPALAGGPGAAGAEGISTGDEGIKKKKRRSRGGAKRTARKHALRLAAGEMLPGTDNAAETTGADLLAENPAEQPETRKSTVITKSVPVKRGGRRNEPGRGVPRTALFASAPVADAVDAEMPTPEAVLPLVSAPAVIIGTGSSVAVEPAEGRKSRSSRNKKGRNPQAADLADAAEPTAASLVSMPESGRTSTALASAEQLSGASAPIAAAPHANTQPTAGEIPAVGSAPAAARRPSRAKSRAVSGARSEKPAVDTPVVPVRDASELRNQVAGGSMTGSTAKLVAPTASVKKAAPPKAAAPKKATVPKAKATKALLAAVPAALAASEAPASPTPAPARIAKPKAPAKPKAAKPKPAAASPEPAKPAAKPRAPRKPAKPA